MLIDDREGSRRLMRYRSIAAVSDLSRLEAGDVFIVGNGPDDGAVLVGVEVKSIDDFISSGDTGRLQVTQVPKMLTTYDLSWVLVYGQYRAGHDGRLQLRKGQGWKVKRLGSRFVPYGYVESLMLTLSASGLLIRTVNTEDDAATWLAALHRWWTKPWADHKGLRVLQRPVNRSLMPHIDDNMRRRIDTASAWPGMGFERAYAAAQHFLSIEDMVHATVADWQQVPGVGKVLAQAVVDAIRYRG